MTENREKGGKRRNSLLKWTIGVVLLVLLLALGVYTGTYVFRTYPQISPKVHLPLAVQVQKAAVMNLPETVGALTTTVPFKVVNVHSNIAATIKEMPVKLGEVVTPRTVVVQLDDRQYQAGLHQAETDLHFASVQQECARRTLERYKYLYDQKLSCLAELEKYQQAYAYAMNSVGVAQKAVAAAKILLEGAKICSPVYGVLSAQFSHVGEWVEPNTRLMSIGQITPVLAMANVPEEKIQAVSVGQEASVTFDAFEGRGFSGKVYKIDANTDPKTRTFPAYIELANPDQVIRLGLTGYTAMKRQVRALAVPSIAVIDLFDKPIVFVVKDKKAWVRHIAPGGIASGYTWIRQGLEEGDEVVIAGHRYLKQGEQVNVMQKLNPELPARIRPVGDKS